MQNQSCFGGRLIVAPLVHLLLIPSTPMHLKLINNPLCYLTDQIIIREVQLKSCHTLIKKCSFNFFEQCTYILYKYVNSLCRPISVKSHTCRYLLIHVYFSNVSKGTHTLRFFLNNFIDNNNKYKMYKEIYYLESYFTFSSWRAVKLWRA